MRRPRRPAGGLRPLLLLVPFAALLYVATFALRYPDRLLGPTTVAVTVTAQAATGAEADPARPRPSSPRRRTDVSRIDIRALDAAPPLHAAAARAFQAGARLLRDALSVSAAASPSPARVPAPPRCPPSTALSGERLRAAGGVLALPCGLVLGSHVTVLASPRRVHGDGLAQFAVELRGEGDGDSGSTILHLNPRLRGDWSGRPVIELNTRFRGQWGPALRCEGWRRSDEDTDSRLCTAHTDRQGRLRTDTGLLAPSEAPTGVHFSPASSRPPPAAQSPAPPAAALSISSRRPRHSPAGRHPLQPAAAASPGRLRPPASL